MKETKRILVATDFSPASNAALRTALQTARETDAELLIAHVLEVPVLMSEGYVLPRMYDEIAEAVRNQASRRMKRMLGLARRAGVRARGLLLRGSPHVAMASLRRALILGIRDLLCP